MGSDNVILIDKYIDIYDEDGSLRICLGPEDTKPPEPNETLDIAEHRRNEFALESVFYEYLPCYFPTMVFVNDGVPDLLSVPPHFLLVWLLP